ncbi:hypothetical protein PAXRUDRAFT_180577, partial [Paxillus rubicundulus Ve08.2h10]
CEFLPPYALNFNPIKLAFLDMMELSDEEIYITLLCTLYIITPMDIFGWYAHCGYK